VSSPELAEAARFDDAAGAERAVATLVEAGIGAVAVGEAVLVVPGDRRRAREVLGLPDDQPGPPPEELARLARRRQAMLVLVIFAVAMVVIPLIAGVVTYKLSGG